MKRVTYFFSVLFEPVKQCNNSTSHPMFCELDLYNCFRCETPITLNKNHTLQSIHKNGKTFEDIFSWEVYRVNLRYL